MEKRKWLFKAVTAALLSVSAVGVATSVNNNTQPVQAARATYSVSLKRNSYVYNKRGLRKGKMKLKKGQFITTYGVTAIKGKKFYRLTKGRYIKAANVVKRAKNISSTTMGNDLVVTLTKEAPVYDSKGKPTGTMFKKGLVVATQGKTKINGKKYYVLKSKRYLSADDVKAGDDRPDSTSTSTPVENSNEEKRDKPTQEEIKQLLANNNDKQGYAVYFSNEELIQIKNSLWSKIQDYRVQNGYEPYKSDPELDGFINRVSSSTKNMFLYSEDINNQELSKYLPNLESRGMRTVQAVDHYKYYGNYLGAPANFNIKDRNPEHVAAEIFNSLKADPFYEDKIVGLFDKKAFGSLGLTYNWDGNYSTVGLVFIEVAGTSKEWTNYYNSVN